MPAVPSNSESAAGVTPSIRDAWPTVAGRWRDSFSQTSEDRPRTRDVDWKRARDQVLDVYMEGNVARFIETLRAHRYYPTIDPPTISRSGDSGIVILRPPDAEAVFYTIDGSDPRQAGASHFTDSKRVIHGREIVRARAKRGGEWSALNEFPADAAQQ